MADKVIAHLSRNKRGNDEEERAGVRLVSTRDGKSDSGGVERIGCGR
jgi:hypothetical protein